MTMMTDQENNQLRQRLHFFNLAELSRRSDVSWHRIRDFRSGKVKRLGQDDVRKIEQVIDRKICGVGQNLDGRT